MNELSAAVVLTAGRGERMRPLSDVLPKPALPLTDGPVVASALRLAARSGAARVVCNTWHLADLMGAAVAGANRSRRPVEISREESLMGTAGGLALARDRGLLGSAGPVLVINGDGLSELDIDPLIALHSERRDAVTLGLLPHPDPLRWSRVLVDDRGGVFAIRPPGRNRTDEPSRVYPGVMVVSRDALDELPSSPGEIANRLWFPALEIGRLGGAMISGTWREVGTAADYLAVILDQLAGKSLIHPDANVAPTALVTASFIGSRATIGDGAVVSRSVVVEGGSVAAGGRVSRSVVLGRIGTDPGERVDNGFRVGPIEKG